MTLGHLAELFMRWIHCEIIVTRIPCRESRVTSHFTSIKLARSTLVIVYEQVKLSPFSSLIGSHFLHLARTHLSLLLVLLDLFLGNLFLFSSALLSLFLILLELGLFLFLFLVLLLLNKFFADVFAESDAEVDLKLFTGSIADIVIAFVSIEIVTFRAS